MKIKIYSKVFAILKKLHPIEYRELQKQISISGNTSTSLLRSQIVNLIRNRNLSYDEFKRKFKKIKERKLNEELVKIFKLTKEVIIFEKVLDVTLSNSEFFKEKFRLLKEIPFIMMIRKNGNIDLSLLSIEKNIKVAENFELLEELILYLQMKIDISYYNIEISRLDEIISKLEYTERVNGLLRSCKMSYERYMSNALTKSNADLKKLISETLSHIEGCYNESGSKRIYLYLCLTQMEKAIVYHEYNFGYQSGMNLLKLLLNNSHLYSENRVFTTLSYLAHNQLCSLDFSGTFFFIDEALKYKGKDSISNVANYDFLIRAEIFLMNYSAAKECLDYTSSLNSLSSYPFYYSKFKYYQAIVHFLEGDFDKAWKILSQHLDLEKDKEGWRVWLSIMRIICQIERKEYIDVDMQIQSFRKYIQRWEQKSEIRERDKIVFSILESLNRNHFDFRMVAEEEEEKLTVLSYPTGDLKWEPNSPELVLFHEWFTSKLENQAYEPDFDKYRTKNPVHNHKDYLIDIQSNKS